MPHRISRTVFLALVAAALFVRAQEPKCSFTARECDQQIRQMLTGRRFLGVTIEELKPGLAVKAVAPNSPAARAGLRQGDRVIAVNGKSLTQASSRDFKQVLADARETGKLWMIIWRHGAYSKVETRLEPFTKEQIDKIVSAHLAHSHTTTAGAQ
ncbi:MAG TPA: PDZ domain-containing protein [Thermoanaerobaculia bacterium]|jgi:predicted metalloprotease with PDZ domain